MDQLVTDVRASEWAQIIAECNASGQTRGDWCSEHGINIHAFYYWQRRLRTETFETIQERKLPAVSFAELPVMQDVQQEPSAQKVHIKVRGLTIDLEGDPSPGVLALVRELLGHAS